MIEAARDSLDKFLQRNSDYIQEDTFNLIRLRTVWLDMNPKFHEYDVLLDVVWEGLSGPSTKFFSWQPNFCCLDCFKPDKDFFKGPHAKSFKVVIKDWAEEKLISGDKLC
jgi:hypothetical protein